MIVNIQTYSYDYLTFALGFIIINYNGQQWRILRKHSSRLIIIAQW